MRLSSRVRAHEGGDRKALLSCDGPSARDRGNGRDRETAQTSRLPRPRTDRQRSRNRRLSQGAQFLLGAVRRRGRLGGDRTDEARSRDLPPPAGDVPPDGGRDGVLRRLSGEHRRRAGGGDRGAAVHDTGALRTGFARPCSDLLRQDVQKPPAPGVVIAFAHANRYDGVLRATGAWMDHHREARRLLAARLGTTLNGGAMTAAIIDGHLHAQNLLDHVAVELGHFPHAPGLAVVLVGDNPASHMYVRSKTKMARKLGLRSETTRLPDDATEAEVVCAIATLNARDDIDGILVQLPLPAHIETQRVMAAVDPAKDVDGLHALNAGRLAHGTDALVPCTPLGCLKLIKSKVADLTGCHAVVIGSSNIVGKPMA